MPVVWRTMQKVQIQNILEKLHGMRKTERVQINQDDNSFFLSSFPSLVFHPDQNETDSIHQGNRWLFMMNLSSKFLF